MIVWHPARKIIIQVIMHNGGYAWRWGTHSKVIYLSTLTVECGDKHPESCDCVISLCQLSIMTWQSPVKDYQGSVIYVTNKVISITFFVWFDGRGASVYLQSQGVDSTIKKKHTHKLFTYISYHTQKNKNLPLVNWPLHFHWQYSIPQENLLVSTLGNSS